MVPNAVVHQHGKRSFNVAIDTDKVRICDCQGPPNLLLSSAGREIHSRLY
jgi:hypothetical protein